MKRFSNEMRCLFILMVYNCTGTNLTTICQDVCFPCLENIISCSKGGLDRIPTDLYLETKKITLIGHTFLQSFLSRENFTKFAKPKYSIEQLSIRDSNIEKIQYQTFFDVSGLDFLDLSENKKMKIENRAFDNLKLKHLKLDKIGTLEFDSQAFQGLLVSSLSIKQSRLKDLPFSLIEPLSQELRHLFLSKNHLTHLSSQFEALFRQLNTIDLDGNPFICSCGLLWLGVTLKWRESHFSPGPDSFSTVPPQAVCDNPSYLKEQLIYKIPEWEFNCQPPKLERIEVQFRTYQSAILRCAASLKAKRAPIRIYWQYLNSPESYPSKLLATTKGNEAEIEITRMDYVDKYFCSVSSSAGNASVKVNFNWPTVQNLKNWVANSTNNYYFVSKPPWKSNDFHENYFFREQYTLLELLGSIFGTFIVTILVFIIIYKFYFFKTIKMKKEQMKKSGYVTYEAGLYSDSQTYDIPQYTSSDFRNKFYQPVFQIPQNRLYADCKEQKAI